MSIGFTAIGSGVTYRPLSLAVGQEIALAYTERRQGSFQSSAAAITDGQRYNQISWLTSIQNWIEANCTRFADHTQAVAGSFDGQAEVPMFTLASFRAAAGLNASGFRRTQDWTPHPVTPNWMVDVAFSYGIALEKDIAGPWNFYELQAALSTLKWYVSGWSTAGRVTPGYYQLSVSRATCGLALAAQTSLWNHVWGNGGLFLYENRASLVQTFVGSGGDPDIWVCAGSRSRHRGATFTVPTFSPLVIDRYYFFDTANSVHYHETYPEKQVATRGGDTGEATYIGDLSTNPVDVFGLTCPSGGGDGETSGKFRHIYKWNFTNSN